MLKTALPALLLLTASTAITAQVTPQFIEQKGPTLGYVATSGVKIIQVSGLSFKDLNRNGKLDSYEDWRLPVDSRAKDLAAKMTVEQIAGLMLYSSHQMIPSRGNFGPLGAATYNGKPFAESGALPSDLSDQQKSFLTKDNLRHVLVVAIESPAVAATWNNNAQALAESLGLGIPANNSSDPRNGASASAEYNAGAGGKISMWPEELGLAATFDPAITQKFGQIAAREYRALGITTALSPQIDLGTEPRWNRLVGTFGEDPTLSADMARAYVDGFQTSTGKDETRNGWGINSVNAMVKHWPGGGPEEGGRDGHFAYGKFAVYPGNQFGIQLVPFLNGAFALKGKTKKAAAVMPYYTISYNQDGKYKENVGNGFSKYMVTDLLREKYKYDGVVCTDWLITADEGKTPDQFLGKSWGVESLTLAQRHYKVIMAGVDQFGGNNDVVPVLAAYQLGVQEKGEAWMRARFEQSAVRLLRNIFQVGLFENPYIDPVASEKTVGNPAFMRAGYEAQLKSIVLLKNRKQVLPLKSKAKVFVPQRYIAPSRDWFGRVTEAKTVDPVQTDLLKKYFDITTDPAAADVAIVFAEGPKAGTGYSSEDRKKGGNGYVPISLQYGPYTATTAREQSIAAGDPVIDPTITNRSYKNKTTETENSSDLKMILDTKAVMGNKPVIVCLSLHNPAVVAEFEDKVDGLLVAFGVQDQAMLDILTGIAAPSGLLPIQMPANMDEVETQREDVPHDMKPYKDSEGNTYNFGFGLHWKGVINDQRTNKYKK